MGRGVKKGYRQSVTHIENRNANRTKWNGGHNLLTTADFITKLKDKWPECPYDLTLTVYVRNDCKVSVGCPEHGNFEKWPSDLLNKSGCPKCSGNGFSKEEYLSELVDKFPDYDFSRSVYVNAITNMLITCKAHGEFMLSRNALLTGVRCVECTKARVARDRVAAGRARDPALMSEFEKYKKAVWKETDRSYKLHKEHLGERSRTRHLDHIYSILHGFRDSVSPVILGNIVNLRIIDSKENQSKNSNSHFTKEELIMLYEGRNK